MPPFFPSKIAVRVVHRALPVQARKTKENDRTNTAENKKSKNISKCDFPKKKKREKQATNNQPNNNNNINNKRQAMVCIQMCMHSMDGPHEWRWIVPSKWIVFVWQCGKSANISREYFKVDRNSCSYFITVRVMILMHAEFELNWIMCRFRCLAWVDKRWRWRWWWEGKCATANKQVKACIATITGYSSTE